MGREQHELRNEVELELVRKMKQDERDRDKTQDIIMREFRPADVVIKTLDESNEIPDELKRNSKEIPDEYKNYGKRL